MSNQFFFSIVIPTYNRANDLERCLNSLVKQTYRDFEVLICDDGSTDHTKDVVGKFSDKLTLKYLYNENSGGPAGPRNLGIKNANGEWICLLDSDDWCTSDKLEYIYNLNLKNIDFIYHKLISIDRNGVKDTMFTRQINNKRQVIDLLTRFNPILTSSACIKKTIFIENDLSFSENKKIVGVEDFDMWIRMAHAGVRFKMVSKNLGFYRKEGLDSISYGDERQVARLHEVYSSYQHILSPKNQKKSLAAFSYQKAVLLLGNNDKSESLKNLVLAMKNGVVYIKLKALIRIVKLKLLTKRSLIDLG